MILKPETMEELKWFIAEVWDELSYSTINGLVDDFPLRYSLVLKNIGEKIQHFIKGGKLTPITDAEITNLIDELKSKRFVYWHRWFICENNIWHFSIWSIWEA